MAGSRQSFTMQGGGPWGLRLMGGDGDALIVARLRQRSKAANCGLQEFDEVVSINGVDTSGMSHATASRLLENAGQTLTIDVIRGGHAPHATVPQPLGSMPSSGPVPTTPLQTLSAPPKAQPERVSTPDFTVPVHREEHMYQDHGETRRVKTETQQQKFGTTTVTKVSKEITHVDKPSYVTRVISPVPHRPSSPRRHRATPPQHHQKSFTSAANHNFSPVQPAQITASPQPESFSPVFAPAPQNAYRPPGYGPTASDMQTNHDGSFTMTVGMGSLQPAHKPDRLIPQFKVKKVTAAINPNVGTWQPGGPSAFQPAPQRAPSPPRAPSPAMPTVWQPAHPPQDQPIIYRNPTQHPPPQRYLTPEPEPDYGYPEYDQVDMEPIDLTKYQRGGYEFSSEDEYIQDEGGALGRRPESGTLPEGPSLTTMREKIYADSAFYDDPEHKYPTIEEQIKMARKVALSLMAPQNKEARGHKMFMKRRKKSDRWVAGQMVPQEDEYYEVYSDEEEKYYNPNPWRASGMEDKSHTWQPVKPTPPPPPPKPVPAYQAPKPFQPAIPPAPPAPPAPPTPQMWEPRAVDQSHIWQPKIQEAPDERRMAAMSHNEVEDMLLRSQKTKHDAVAPEVAFSLADDLRNMKGRGGRLFAKRRERAEQWVVDDDNVQRPSAPNPEIMKRLATQSAIDRARSPAHGGGQAAPSHPVQPITNGMPKNRLTGMIKNKAPMTPWEAAERSTTGNVEAAFSHLHQPILSKKNFSVKSNLNKPTSVFQAAPQSGGWGMPSVHGTSIAREDDPLAAGASGAPQYGRAPQAYQGGGSGASGAGFRPINFRPPLGSQNRMNMGVFESTTAAQPWNPSTPSVTSSHSADGSAGYCDL